MQLCDPGHLSAGSIQIPVQLQAGCISYVSVLLCLLSPSSCVMEEMKGVTFSAFERHVCKGNSLINKPG